MTGHTPERDEEGYRAPHHTAATHRSAGSDDSIESAHLNVLLPFDATVAGIARTAVSRIFGDDRGADEGGVALACTEMVTNALLHGSPPIVLDLDLDLSKTDPAVEITVTDGGAALMPRTGREEQGPEEWGRGLLIVDSLAVKSSLDIGTAGTRAWCRLPLSAPPAPPAPVP
ncbi:ATP-binding protein [Streptomyces jumonjinensis]|uniref:ATP-binding protein n=1 Tax=Streptomyces jumonjinensis TaxID=1945 RepID=UPI003788AA09